jgi:hypothetical protein
MRAYLALSELYARLHQFRRNATVNDYGFMAPVLNPDPDLFPHSQPRFKILCVLKYKRIPSATSQS